MALVLNTAVFWLRLALSLLGFSVAICWLVLLRVIRTSRSYSRQSFGRAMARLMCPPLGIRVRFSGAEFLERVTPCIYVANHQSYVDYPIAGLIFPGNAVVLARQVGQLPVLGALFRSTGNISVDRDVPTRAAVALDEAEQAIRERRNSVWIFPEGTRGTGSGKLGPFKRGAFRLAIGTGAPVVPVVISPLKPYTDLRARRLDRRDVFIQILPPIDVAAYTVADETTLRDHVHHIMKAALEADMRNRSALVRGREVR